MTKKTEKSTPVAKCNQTEEVVANYDHKNLNIESLIHIMRGQKVMLDSDLAMLYGVSTSRLNEQVKRNINRFPEDFMFQITKEEWIGLTSQIAILKTGRGQHRKFLPHVFTRNGIGMLSSVLKSRTAVEVNIRIMRAFTAIPEMLNNNALMMQRILSIEQHQTETDAKVNQIITTIEKRFPEQLPEQLFATGCVWDAWAYVSDLVRSAKRRIVLIDNFVDDRVLSLFDKREDGVVATIHSRYYEPFLVDLKKHNTQCREIRFVQLPQKNHDRFLIVDDEVYLLGASVKDMGTGMCAVTKMQTTPETVLGLLK